jgi:hypothetical protein
MSLIFECMTASQKYRLDELAMQKTLRIRPQNLDATASNDELHGHTFGSFSEQKKPRKMQKNAQD